ncbi:ABC transporter substrate-binding protein, partial [Acinetobacter baumannii]
GGPGTDSTYGALFYLAGSINTPVGKKFLTDWQAKYNREPTQYEGMGYDVIYVLAEAIKSSANGGKPTPEGIRDALHTIKNLDRATGPITI